MGKKLNLIAKKFEMKKIKTIKILTKFKNHLDNLMEINKIQTIYAQRIKDIIQQERKNSNKTISLKKYKHYIIINILQEFSNNKPNNEKAFASSFQEDNNKKSETK